MVKKCFFCDIQKQKDDKKIIENEDFFSRYDDFPISKGHAEIIPKKHVSSFFGLSESQLQNLFDLLKKTKEHLSDAFNPDGFNIGINEGEAAGQSISHLHIHIIPRYLGDVKNPRGGVRNIFPEKADYVPDAKKIPSMKGYFEDKTIKYNKLVRDRIPEIIKANGKIPITRVASDNEYWKMLKEKLQEELNEFSEAENEEEIADILEVLYAIADFKSFDKKGLELLRKKKAKERGRFKDKIILEETME